MALQEGRRLLVLFVFNFDSFRSISNSFMPIRVALKCMHVYVSVCVFASQVHGNKVAPDRIFSVKF